MDENWWKQRESKKSQIKRRSQNFDWRKFDENKQFGWC